MIERNRFQNLSEVNKKELIDYMREVGFLVGGEE